MADVCCSNSMWPLSDRLRAHRATDRAGLHLGAHRHEPRAGGREAGARAGAAPRLRREVGTAGVMVEQLLRGKTAAPPPLPTRCAGPNRRQATVAVRGPTASRPACPLAAPYACTPTHRAICRRRGAVAGQGGRSGEFVDEPRAREKNRGRTEGERSTVRQSNRWEADLSGRIDISIVGSHLSGLRNR